jgi:hypothetical protein
MSTKAGSSRNPLYKYGICGSKHRVSGTSKGQRQHFIHVEWTGCS